MINDPAVELDLLIRSCSGQMHNSMEWCTLNTDPVVGLTEALASLANDFGNTSVLTRTFMMSLCSGDKGRVHKTVADLHTFKVGLENF